MTDPDTFPDRGATRFVRPRSLGDIVSASLRFLIDHARPLAVGQLTIAGPALVLFVAVQALTGTAEVFSPETPFAFDADRVVERFGATLLVPYLAYLVFALVSYGVAFGYVGAYRRGIADGRVDWDDVRPTLWPLASVTLVMFGLTVVIGVVVGVFFTLIGVALGPVAGVALAFALLGLTVYAIPVLAVAYPARLFGTDRSGQALVRGVRLVRGRWWMAFGTLLVLMLVAIVLSVVVAVPAAIVDAVRDASGAPQTPWTLALMSAFNHLGSLLIATLFGIGSAFLHGSLSADADDVEMLDDLTRLEADPDAPEPEPTRSLREAEPHDRWAPPTAAPTEAAPEPTSPGAEPPADASDGESGGFRGGGFRGGGFGA